MINNKTRRTTTATEIQMPIIAIILKIKITPKIKMPSKMKTSSKKKIT